MHYIDANIFIYANLDGGPLGDRARTKLKRTIQSGACTATLTVEEVLWAVKRLKGKQEASAVAQALLQLDVKVFPVERRDIESAIQHFDAGLDPRDAIHAAVALRRKCKTILSTDGAFAKVAGLKHDHLQ